MSQTSEQSYPQARVQADPFKCLWETKNGPDKGRCSAQCPSCARLEAEHADG